MELRHYLSLIPAISALVSCTAPTSHLEGRKISCLDLVFDGEKTVAEERLRQFIEAKPGAIYSASLTDEDTGRLFQTGLIDDIRILTLPEKDGGVVVKYTVKTRPPIGPGGGFTGNTAFRDEVLAKVTGLKELPTTQRDTMKAIGSLERFYRRNGYRNARVSVRRIRRGGVTAEVYFEIREGPAS